MKIIAAAFVAVGDEVLLVKVFETNGTTGKILHLVNMDMRRHNILYHPSSLPAYIKLCDFDTSRFPYKIPSSDEIVTGNDIVKYGHEQDCGNYRE